MSNYHWHRFNAAESFNRIRQGENHWVAFGDFLDDWRRSRPEDRLELALEPLGKIMTPEERPWAALFAAAIEQLCAQDRLTPPSWLAAPEYSLQEPWYAGTKSEGLRRFQEETTPEIFKKHNVLAGDRILDRV